MTSSQDPWPPQASGDAYASSGQGLARPRPQHLGLASGLTIAVGALALILSGFMLLAALFVEALAGVFLRPFADVPFGVFTGVLLLTAVVPLVYGIVTVLAGVRLSKGEPGAFTTAVAVNVLSVALAVVTMFGGGLGLVHGALSGVALWALYQPDMKAFFGR